MAYQVDPQIRLGITNNAVLLNFIKVSRKYAVVGSFATVYRDKKLSSPGDRALRSVLDTAYFVLNSPTGT